MAEAQPIVGKDKKIVVLRKDDPPQLGGPGKQFLVGSVGTAIFQGSEHFDIASS